MDLIFTGKLFQSLGPVYAILFWKEELLGLDTLKTVAVRALVDKTRLSMNFSFLFKENIIFISAIGCLSLTS